ncbi:hypothetical protein GYMLUDRAFT_242860 [Collybiopsis luxurians FD-317 M1]|uniref:Unplaced genomic scaffold GYMLUscaffold_20, whole genome shotgun sequence n=1 Tax=Collybiopsis luxurians FD-317 M1 TaxID=944289 RepID=A0A0D0CZV6_9AGAR|nr:hypothetical protein GYMLUDRAFT_242860 [Collybiopsis luxurians FD-317 M1]
MFAQSLTLLEWRTSVIVSSATMAWESKMWLEGLLVKFYENANPTVVNKVISSIVHLNCFRTVASDRIAPRIVFVLAGDEHIGVEKCAQVLKIHMTIVLDTLKNIAPNWRDLDEMWPEIVSSSPRSNNGLPRGREIAEYLHRQLNRYQPNRDQLWLLAYHAFDDGFRVLCMMGVVRMSF